MVRFKEPLLQQLAEKLIKGDDNRRLLRVNGGTPHASIIPSDQKYADMLRKQIEDTKEQLDQLEAVLLIYEAAKKAGLSLEVEEVPG